MNFMSDQNSSDRQAKNLSNYLYSVIQNDKQSRWLLRTHGLSDWIKYDHVLSDDPIELSADVLVYLCNYNTMDKKTILLGILGFLEHHGYGLDRNQLPLLKPLLETIPIDQDQVLAWFKCSFKIRNPAPFSI